MENKLINRDIFDRLLSRMFQGKVIVLYGARQVGKTTLVKQLLGRYPSEDTAYYNCDEIDVREKWQEQSAQTVKRLIFGKKLIVIDEAQRVPEIGLVLKIAVDNFPEVQIVATGSSSFELAAKINEPLTGRKFEFHLYPFSVTEAIQELDSTAFDQFVSDRLIYGLYPEVVLKGDDDDLLKILADSYLYKDILQYDRLRQPEMVVKLLQALALQIGQEVSYNELATTVGIDKVTVANYVRLLEQTFIIFRLPPFSRNLRNELKKLRKIYFFDLGIRNALINNFNPLNTRADVGALWENFVISERMKVASNQGKSKNFYFWRTKERKEIDLIEDAGGKLNAFEIKASERNWTVPKAFTTAYPDATGQLITMRNWREYLL